MTRTWNGEICCKRTEARGAKMEIWNVSKRIVLAPACTSNGEQNLGGHLTPFIRKGQRCICPNPECDCEMEVTKGSLLDSAGNPRCGSGVEMKKAYRDPTISTRPMEDRESSDTVV